MADLTISKIITDYGILMDSLVDCVIKNTLPSYLYITFIHTHMTYLYIYIYIYIYIYFIYVTYMHIYNIYIHIKICAIIFQNY